ncbi:AraC family transcriptional regulator [Ancylobacter sp. Lp-2]|nr:AraC family transcriptional regulator [Ancylobacter sp. Lp-2]
MVVSTSSDCRVSLEMARLRYDQPNFGEVSVPANASGFIINIQLGDLHKRKVRCGKTDSIITYNRDAISIHDLREDYSAELLTPFDFAVCHVPYETFEAIAQEVGIKNFSTFDCSITTCDPVAASLCRALLPGLHRQRTSEAIFVDSTAVALVSHLASTYGGRAPAPATGHGGLAEWQKRRAIELLSLTGDAARNMSVAIIAAECRLSRSHFVRLFKKTTGLPPHRWLTEYRLDKARRLLMEGSHSIAEIADRCGFSDQAHLTRSFASAVGITPAAWRKRLKS